MSLTESLELIGDSGLIAVVRGLTPEAAVNAAQALYAGGVRVLEITVDSPGALETIGATATAMKGKALVGAGTVLDAATAAAAIRSGAEFLFAPNLNVQVIEVANLYGRVAIPGVMTPTEMARAAQAGAPAVKLFPANVLGPEFIKQVRAPLPHIPIVPTGGIGPDNVSEFIQAGALAVGVGGGLLIDDAKDGRFDRITERAETLVKLIAEARAGGR